MTPEESFEQYVATRMAALTRTAYLLTGNHHDAEHLVQRSLIKAVAKWSRIADHPEPYVRRIMYHDNISRWRRRPVGEHLVGAAPDRPAAEDDAATRVTLHRALARLTPKQRTVLVLRYYEDLTEPQIAAALGIGIGTVKSQTRHALQRLRSLAPELESIRIEQVFGSHV
jgi:RNA polymerase sigma-70 factor (sigma-E family)